MPEGDTDERRSLASALGGVVHSWWEGLSQAGRWARGIMALIALSSALVVGIRGAASMIVDIGEIMPRIQSHERRLSRLEEDTTDLYQLLQRVDQVEERTEVQAQVMRNFEIRLDQIERKVDRVLCYLKADAEQRNAYDCG